MQSKSHVSRNDLVKLKDKLKKCQQRHGGVSKEEWSNSCYATGLLDDDYVENFFKMFDLYNNEWVDFKEFAVYSALVARSDDKNRIDFCYRAFDKNGSGQLDLEELTNLMGAVARTLKRTNYALPGLKIDPDMPTFEDSPKERKQLEGIAEDVFEALDQNADGEISYKEFFKGATKVPLIKKTLQYFTAISDHLPESLDVEADGKAKKKKKKAGDDDDDEDDSAADKKKKKGSAKGKKGGKKGSKKGKSEDTQSATSDSKKKKGAKGKAGKKGDAKDKKKASGKGSAKGKKKASTKK
jgi:Ca2+-binding EF-hand superfamily protein